MRKTLTLAVMLSVFSLGAASAADLARRSVAVPAAPPAWNWTGLYLGAHGGYAWGSGDLNGMKGGFGGGQIGYNYQPIGSNWLIGIEGDISGASIKDSATQVLGPVVATANGKTDMLASVRGRIGAVFDRNLVYFTGGAAWAHNELTFTAAIPGFAVAGSSSNTHLGWTIGAGWEYAFANNWSARVEYLYTSYEDKTYFNFFQAGGEINQIRVGVNYLFR
jgi:outer membrane immunogenic protein